MKSHERYVARLKPGNTADLMKSIEDRLADYALSDDAGCGELLKKLKMNLRNAGNICSESSAADKRLHVLRHRELPAQ